MRERPGQAGYGRGPPARTDDRGKVWDLGANTGEYSRAAREVAPLVVSFDMDPAAVERNYRRVRAEGEKGILAFLLDLTNPSPALGWAGSASGSHWKSVARPTLSLPWP